MNFQSIIQNILSNPILIIMIIGGFSALGRGIKAAQEKKAQKRQLQQLRDAQRDSLRTGQRPTPTQSTSQTTSKGASKFASTDIAESTPATWDQKQDLRRQRIEKLRQQRMEQLNKIKQRRSASKSSSSTSGQAQPPQPQSKASPKPPKPVQRARSVQQPTPPQVNPAPRRRPRPNIIPAGMQSKTNTPPVIETDLKLGKTLDKDSTITSGSIVKDASSDQSSKAFLTKNLRQAVLAKEILSPPIAMRAPDDGTASIQ